MGEVVDDARPNRVWVQFGTARLGSSASSESQADDGSTWAVLTALSASASPRVNCRSVGETSAASRSVGPNTSQPRARPNVTAHAAGRRRGVDVAAVQDHAGSQEGFARPRRMSMFRMLPIMLSARDRHSWTPTRRRDTPMSAGELTAVASLMLLQRTCRLCAALGTRVGV